MSGAHWRLDGRAALVTGASSGLGAATALELASRGARVAIAARRAEHLERVAEQIRASSGECVAIPADLSDPAQCGRLINAAGRKLGGVDILVNNAALGASGAASEVSPAEFDATLRLNLVAAYACATGARAMMADRGYGKIVNVASIMARVASPFPGRAAYSASKAGLLGLTRDLASQWGSRGIRVNAVVPGFFASDLSRDALSAGRLERIQARTALGRPADVEEIAPTIAFLCLPASDYITGTAVTVDGGWLAR